MSAVSTHLQRFKNSVWASNVAFFGQSSLAFSLCYRQIAIIFLLLNFRQKMNYLDELNPTQRVAVEQISGPSMVIAGAGSGKTRVLTYRIAHMLTLGIDPFHILALTFTNKAAREMKERIEKIIDSGTLGYRSAHASRHLTMGTFHSVFSRILRTHADKLGFTSNFTIYDTEDSLSVMKAVINDMKLDIKTYKPSLMLGYISKSKNDLKSYEQYQNDEKLYGSSRHTLSEIGRIFEYYVKRCKRSDAMDFDDLLYYTYVLLRVHPDILASYQHKFQYILVDEYQDTNFAQYTIIKMLAAAYENICVVGDDAQSIYSFRGADIENIFKFRSDYPDHRLFKLEQNYRSTQTIVNAANSVIGRNVDQIKKDLWTDNSHGKQIAIIRTLTEKEEGKQVAHRIFNLKKEMGCAYKDIAILYRANRQTRSFEEALRILNIPYKVYSGISFYQRREIKDTLAYFRLAVNPTDEEAFKRAINYPKRGIGKASVEKVIVAAHQHGVSIWNVLTNMNVYPLAISQKTRQEMSDFVTMIASFTAQIDKLSAYELGLQIVKSSGISKDLYAQQENGPEEVERYQNLEELLSGLQSFTMSKQETQESASLVDFMNDVALLTNSDVSDPENEDHVSLMTIHTSKGLEFEHVFLGGVEENLFPTQQSLQTKQSIEEERRLFYVAITRAMSTCTISYTISRFRVGIDARSNVSEPSRFIYEIEPEYVHHETIEQKGGRSLNQHSALRINGFKQTENSTDPKNTQLKPINRLGTTTNNTLYGLKVGDTVMHATFGKGRVAKLEGLDPNKMADIFFPGHGMRKIFLRFAKIERIEE